jgi:hypothetical protein
MSLTRLIVVMVWSKFHPCKRLGISNFVPAREGDHNHPYGRDLDIRLMPNQVPFKGPYLRKAASVYAEQVG